MKTVRSTSRQPCATATPPPPSSHHSPPRSLGSAPPLLVPCLALLAAALAGVAGLALGRASSQRGLPHLALTALAVAAVPLGSALLQRALGAAGPPGSSGAGAGARPLQGSRDQRRRQLRRAAQQAADDAAAAGAMTEEELGVLRQLMQVCPHGMPATAPLVTVWQLRQRCVGAAAAPVPFCFAAVMQAAPPAGDR